MQSVIQNITPSIIIALVGAASLHFAVGYFDESRHSYARMDLWLNDVLKNLSTAVIRIVDDELIRWIDLSAKDVSAIHLDKVKRRLIEEAVARLYLDMKMPLQISASWESWQIWESRGKTVCQFGSLFNVVLILLIGLVLILGPNWPDSLEKLILALAILALIVPVLTAILCWYFTFIHRRIVESKLRGYPSKLRS